MKDRESAMLRLELGCQSAGDCLMDMKEVMRLVFGNRVVRETAIHSGMEDQSQPYHSRMVETREGDHRFLEKHQTATEKTREEK